MPLKVMRRASGDAAYSGGASLCDLCADWRVRCAVYSGADFARAAGLNSTELSDVLLYGQYHRLATSLFIHNRLVHLLVVLFVLYTFGAWQERIFGHVRFIAIYLLGDLAARSWRCCCWR
ncbi:MAG: rhomboid family intramembrane serine protease [Anaerolineae bacterium]